MRIGIRNRALVKALLFGVQMALLFGVFSFVSAEEQEENVVTEEVTDEEAVENESTVEKKTESKGEVIINDFETITTEFSVTPVVANEKAKPRDIIKKELLVTNNIGQRINLYITVENIDPTNGAQEIVSPAVSDLSTSLANWVEITRGVIELAPGESRKIPYLIHVNLTAKPGNYFARIQFRKGSRRDEAEASREGTALMLNVEVEDDAKERLQLGNFISEDSVVFGNTVSFSYLLENIGNREIEPRGSIRIFNRRGEEVGSVPLNASGEEITPDNKSQLAAAWSSTGRFGRYKAFLDLEYGENQLASVQDTVYFWVFPWKEILAALVGVIVLGVLGTYLVHMRSIARPVPIRSKQPQLQNAPQQQYEPQPHQPYHMKVERSLPPAPIQRVKQSGTNHVTVLNPNNQRQSHPRVNQNTQNRTNGSTVELTSRNAQQNTKTQGNVVQLSSRR